MTRVAASAPTREVTVGSATSLSHESGVPKAGCSMNSAKPARRIRVFR
jgi:hypothetical protein